MSLKYEPASEPLHIQVTGHSIEAARSGVSLGGDARSNASLRFTFRDLQVLLFFFFTLVTGPRRSLSLRLSDTRVYEPQTRARLGGDARSNASLRFTFRDLQSFFFITLNPRVE